MIKCTSRVEYIEYIEHHTVKNFVHFIFYNRRLVIHDDLPIRTIIRLWQMQRISIKQIYFFNGYYMYDDDDHCKYCL